MSLELGTTTMGSRVRFTITVQDTVHVNRLWPDWCENCSCFCGTRRPIASLRKKRKSARLLATDRVRRIGSPLSVGKS